MYVQNLLHEDNDVLEDLLRQGAHVYVCGGIQMAADVQKSAIRLLHKIHSISLNKAKVELENMKVNWSLCLTASTQQCFATPK